MRKFPWLDSAQTCYRKSDDNRRLATVVIVTSRRAHFRKHPSLHPSRGRPTSTLKCTRPHAVWLSTACLGDKRRPVGYEIISQITKSTSLNKSWFGDTVSSLIKYRNDVNEWRFLLEIWFLRKSATKITAAKKRFWSDRTVSTVCSELRLSRTYAQGYRKNFLLYENSISHHVSSDRLSIYGNELREVYCILMMRNVENNWVYKNNLQTGILKLSGWVCVVLKFDNSDMENIVLYDDDSW